MQSIFATAGAFVGIVIELFKLFSDTFDYFLFPNA